LRSASITEQRSAGAVGIRFDRKPLPARADFIAVYAESLLFESTFGSAGSGNEVTKRAQLISAGSAAALSSENAETSGATKLPIGHQVWLGLWSTTRNV
jgi:hypothetical protein